MFARTFKNGWSTKFKSIFASVLLIIAQAGPVVFLPARASAVVNECVVDTAGANDEPGQKDLTKLCVDDTAATTVDVTWNWDELGTSGANTMDACALFDTDADGLVNYSICVVTENTPATKKAVVLYSCGDDKPDRCTSPVTAINITHSTACSVSQSTDDPFPTGADYPKDTQADCVLDFADVGGVGNAELLDVCSYPSQQPNSDPSDCVIIKDNSAFIKLVKELEPASDPGLFDLYIDNEIVADDVSDGGNSGFVTVDSDNNGEDFIVKEMAGTGTSLTNYQSEVQCEIEGVMGSVISGTSTTINLEAGESATCTFTNTVKPGSITVIKNTVGGNGTFNFTSNFGVSQLITTGNTASQTVNGLNPGSYSISETVPTGWSLTSAICSDQSDPSSISLSAGENVTCTFTNTKLGSITIVKNTVGGDGTFNFTGTVGVSQLTTNSNTAQQTVQNVSPGTYSIAETVPTGWDLTSTTCSDGSKVDAIELAAGENITCTFTNTKRGAIQIVKNTYGGDDTFYFTSNFGFNQLTTTGNTASQTVSDVVPGSSYSVSENELAGWFLDNSSCNKGTPTAIVVEAGKTTTCTFNNVKFGGISGTKYETDADGDISTASGLANWTIKLLDGNGDLLDTATTDQNGDYFFSMLKPGDYTVIEVMQDGWTQIDNGDTCNDEYKIKLSAGITSESNDFCNFKNGSISGYKWNDEDGDGNVDTEPRLSGWTIELYNADKQKVGTDTTDSNGVYEFTDVALGTYTVCEVMQTGWVQTYPGDAQNPKCQTVTIDESGENLTPVKSRSFGNQGRGTITVIKDVVNDNGGSKTYADFSFDVSSTVTRIPDITGNYSFSMTTSPDGDRTISNVPAGSYSVLEPEANTMGYTTSYSKECSNLVVTAGGNATCTITNNDNQSYVIVDKTVKNDNGGDAKPDDFKLTVNGNAVLDEVKYPVDPGTHTAGETTLPGYAPGLWGGDCNITGQVTVKLGETKTCTITNDDEQAYITVYKEVTNDDGGDAKPDDFKLTLDGDSVTSGVAVPVNPGTYTAAETQLDGYTFTGFSGDCTSKGEITVALGESKSCKLTNNDIAPKLTLYKEVVNNNSGESDASDWTLYATPSEGQELSGNGYDGFVEKKVVAGVDYALSEKGPEGYFVDVDWDCEGGAQVGSKIKLALAETATCWIVNNDVANPDIQIVKSGPEAAHEGDELTFYAAITNIGDAPLHINGVLDDVAGKVIPVLEDGFIKGDDNKNTVLDVNETWYGVTEVPYVVPENQKEDIVNTMLVCADDVTEELERSDRVFAQQSLEYDNGDEEQQLEGDVCDEDTHTTDILHPGVNVVKDGPSSAPAGTTVIYTFTVTNTGDTPLNIGTVDDSIAGAGTYQSGDENENELLDIEETWVYTAQYTIPVGQVVSVDNTVTVCGTDKLQLEVCDEDDHSTSVPQVLAVVTPKLVETGESASAMVSLGFLIIGTTVFVGALSRKQKM